MGREENLWQPYHIYFLYRHSSLVEYLAQVILAKKYPKHFHLVWEFVSTTQNIKGCLWIFQRTCFSYMSPLWIKKININNLPPPLSLTPLHLRFNFVKSQPFLVYLGASSVSFIYSEKATKFCEMSTLLLITVHRVKSKVDFLQNFVAFTEYMNFNIMDSPKLK